MKNRDVLLLVSPVPQNRMLGISRFAKEHRWSIAIGERSSPPTESRRTPVHEQRYRRFCDGFAEREVLPFWDRTTLAKGLATAKKPLGVFCYSDYDATLALNACLSHGLKVPDDVAILGVDNNEIICENQAVPLSSVLHDHEEIGFRGAELLEKTMKEKGKGEKEKVRTVLIQPQRVVQRASTDITATDDAVLRQALDYIAAHLGTSFGLSQIADSLKMPAYRLGELFRLKLGRSAGREIVRQKIVLARKLLEETDKPVKEIASETGFCNIAYFVNTFRRETGSTPRRYRSRL